MTSASDKKPHTVDDYIAQIDTLTKNFPTYGKFKEQDYSDETIETCMGLLYPKFDSLLTISSRISI